MSNKIFPIIGIGASAGGLDPLEKFFENVESKSGFAYVVIQHLAPNHKSLMDELLARHTQIPIAVIENGMTIKANHIYLNPPKKFVEILDGKFVLNEKEDRKLSFPISTFFESLARHRHEKAAGVVLSGTGSDGSEGIKFIKEKGGLVLAQEPESAKFDGMPRNAIHTGSVDKICGISEMPGELVRFFKSKPLQNGSGEINKDHKASIDQILSTIFQQTGVDFSEYKYSTLNRRISRRMGILGFNDLTDYNSYITRTNGEAHLLSKELLIGVTRFFRDEDAFEVVRKKIIPKLVEENSTTKTLRIWVPACSTGEEAYTIAILFKDHLRKLRLQYDVTIFATDLDKEAIKLAAQRVFPPSIVNEIPAEYLSAYFIPQRNGYSIAKEVREMIVFSSHNIIQDPPFGRIDFLSCRNFLIYLKPSIQQRLFSMFQYALRKNGVLFLGSSESLGDMSNAFYELDKRHKIFTNKENKKLLQLRSTKDRLDFDKLQEQQPLEPGDRNSQTERFASNQARRNIIAIQDYLIQEFVPDTIVFNEQFDLVHSTGRVNRWLKLPLGEISTNVLRMLPESLSLSFELMAHKAFSTAKPIKLKNVTPEEDMTAVYGKGKSLDVTIVKLPARDSQGLLAATFQSGENSKSFSPENEIDLNLASREKIDILERELRINRENLQTTIEELESSNEELQAANEELQSSNEELESVNEELYTVNAEFQEKVVELTGSNNDLDNLIKSTDIAILFLDANLQVRKFTPAIRSILNITSHDVGRHISHFRNAFKLEDLMTYIEKVYRDLSTFEKAITNRDGHEFIMRITPFRTAKSEIQGVVLSFIEITAINKTKRQLELSNDALDKIHSKYDQQSELFELIANNAHDMITVHDLKGKAEYVSPAAFEVTGFSPGEVDDENLIEHIPLKNHRKQWKSAFEKILNGKNVVPVNYKFQTKSEGQKWFETSMKSIKSEDGDVVKVLATTRDVSRRKFYQDELQKLSLIATQTNNGVIITDVKGRITFVNNAFERMTGYTEKEVIGQKPGDLLQGENSDPNVIDLMSKRIKAKKGFNVEIVNYTKQGEKILIKIDCEPMRNAEDRVTGFFSIQYEISPQKEYEAQIAALNNLLKEQNNRLGQMNKSLEEFAYVASHDLKAPARNVLGMIELIRKKGTDIDRKKYEQYISIIENASFEMNRLVDNLLEYSRSGKLDEDLAEIELGSTIQNVEQTFSRELEMFDAKVEFQTDVKSIMAYPTLFTRLLNNLLSNAIKYRSEKDLTVNITCNSHKNYYEFAFADNGIGIETGQFDNIFKIFKSVKQDKESNGIGLSVCKKIVEMHNGKIWVESKEGRGSVFKFTIFNFGNQN